MAKKRRAKRGVMGLRAATIGDHDGHPACMGYSKAYPAVLGASKRRRKLPGWD